MITLQYIIFLCHIRSFIYNFGDRQEINFENVLTSHNYMKYTNKEKSKIFSAYYTVHVYTLYR